ncbi:hypothetical protein FRB99_005542 [Tulasnella sp. 403]|nr:hypothetical protein FRB99_005542 [Tulasnella sp. 403]
MDTSVVSSRKVHLPEQRHHSTATIPIPISDRPASPLAHSEFNARTIKRPSSTLPYTQTGIKDRRRSSTRAIRWLVMVFPPRMLYDEPAAREAAQVAPPGRIQNGVLLPLCPTLYAQLSAIAREFGLPSAVGVCLYLQLGEGSQAFFPRLSDEAWSILWSPYLLPPEDAPPSPPAHGFPIAGRLEFDIDLRRARWYHGWVTGTLRSLPSNEDSSIDSTLADTSRTRGDSRASVPTHEIDGAASESGRSGMDHRHRALLGPPSVASGSTTQGPKRLSLLDRRDKTDLPAITPFTAIPPRLTHYALETGSISTRFTQDEVKKPVPQKPFTNGLSPIPQLESPTSSQQRDLNNLVQKWRTSSASIATPILAASPGEPNTPPPRTDTTASVGNTADGTEASQTIDLADYAWSISSRGPPSPSPSESFTVEYAPSLHIIERTYGSVILTPSTRTSWGPDESFLDSPVSNVSRYPSPDIAGRMIEDSPYTPSTVTSWGPPLSDPPTPAHYNFNGDFYRLPSPDIGQRSFDPDMPLETVRAIGQDVGTPAEADVGDGDNAISGMGWPYFSPLLDEAPEESPSNMGWPYFVPSASPPGGVSQSEMGWPYVRPLEDETQKVTIPSQFGWPYAPAAMTTSVESLPPSPATALLPPVEETLTLPGLSVRLDSGYPYFNLYPAGYPTLDIYPTLSCPPTEATVDNVTTSKSLPVALPRPAVCYPDFDLYPAGYPVLDIYPAVIPRVSPISAAVVHSGSLTEKCLPVALPNVPVVYPSFNIYPPTYPSLVIYPEIELPVSSARISEVSVRLPAVTGYPSFEIYPAGYPTLNIYPAVLLPTPVADPKPVATTRPVTVTSLSRTSYPTLDIYPAVYPFVTPYPAIQTEPVRPTPPENVRKAEFIGSPTTPVVVEPIVMFKPYKPRKTHRMLHDEYMASLAQEEPSPPPPPPKADLPPLAVALAPPPRSRARSGTVSRRPSTAPTTVDPPPPVPSLNPVAEVQSEQSLQPSPNAPVVAPVSPPPSIVRPVEPATPASEQARSRYELHALIFGGAEEKPEFTTSPEATTPVGLKRSPSQSSTGSAGGMGPTLTPPSTSPITRLVGLPANPSVTVSGRVAARRATYESPPANGSPVATRSMFVTRTPRILDAVSEDGVLNANAGGVLSSPLGSPLPSPGAGFGLKRSGSLGRMKTNDDFFKQRQSMFAAKGTGCRMVSFLIIADPGL